MQPVSTIGVIQRMQLLAVTILTAAAVGCGGPPPDQTQGGSASDAYDPTNDPLVNPAGLFEPASDDPAAIASDDTLYLQLSGSPNTLNPLFVSSTYEFTVVDLLFSGPFLFNKEMAWGVNDEFVESYEESADLTEFSVRLREGLTWHDGTPLTAHDIVFSWKQILDDRVPALAQKPSVEPITECIALDDRTVRFHQPDGLATARWNLLFPIIPKHLFEKHKDSNPDLQTGEYYTKLAREPIGCGPYRFARWIENDQIILERWEDYPGAKPHFKRVVFRIVPDSNVALLRFEKGDIDALERLTPQQFARESNSPTFAAVGYKGWGTEWAFSYIGWNMDGSNPFFNDARVRRAMTHALNLPLIIDKVYYNLAAPCTGIFHPDSWMYNPQIQPIGYDLDQARSLLDEAGWMLDPSDGWRYRQINGRRVPFEFELLIPQGSSTSPKIAAIFQEDLKQLGVRLTTRTIEWAAFLEKVRNHEFQAQIAGWGTGTDPDTGWNLWRTDQYDKGRNYGGYSNPRVDELFELARREFDQERRADMYREISKIIYDEQPYTFLVNPPILAAFNKRISGVQFSPRGIYNFHPGILSWWTAKQSLSRLP